LRRPAGPSTSYGEAPPKAPDRADWAALIDGATPARLRDIAALRPTSEEPPPGPSPLKVRQWRALPQMLVTGFSNLSLRVRVAALVAVVVGITVSLTSLAAFFTIRTQIYDSFDQSVIGRAQAVLQVQDIEGLVRLPKGIFAAADTRIALLDPNPQDLPIRLSPEDNPPIGPQERAVAARLPDGRPVSPGSIRTVACHPNPDIILCKEGSQFRVVAIPVPKGLNTTGAKDPKDEKNAQVNPNPPTALVFAESTDQIDRTLRAQETALLVIGVAGVALAAYAGVLVARRGLRPVTDLTVAVEHVARTGELQLIDVRGDDELARLGNSFNAMLTAVERSRERQRRLVADAGHELRTPLTSLRTNLDLLKQAHGGLGLSATDKAELLDDVVAQVEELTGLVSDLVELARDDVEKSEGRPVDMAEVVNAAVERARRRAPEVHFDVRVRPWTVFGDARALERAVLNLLDNAGKWSPAGGTVTVRLSDGVVSVADEGPGIAEADLPFVFERFYRSEESRTMPGSGLGLAIVRQAAERHGGTVTADRAPQGGALMRLRLPHSSSVTHTGP
jgi:two-component system sensor histidine kinase MprB